MSVDQLAYDYLVRFFDHFAEDGFFRSAAQNGAWYTECHHRHCFTVTGPGHSVMMTGTFPYRTGIIDNEWFDRTLRGKQYCVEDPRMPIVGATLGKTELKGVSPANLLVPTVGDVLRNVTAGKAKVFGVTLKDRAAVLMAGKHPTGVYWFDVNTGMWVTSKYYRPQLPDYMKEINDSDLVECYGGQSWRLSRDPKTYHLHHPDDSPFEGDAEGLKRAFPHELASESDSRYFKQLMITPFGNELTMRVIMRVIEAEQLGQDDVPDILNVGLSSNDYVGHQFGPYSLEVEDMTYRTDELLGDFLRYLDRQVGAGRWTLFLTADHAVQPIPEYASILGLPGKRKPFGEFDQFVDHMEYRLANRLGLQRSQARIVQWMDMHQIFLQHQLFEGNETALRKMREWVRDYLMDSGAVAIAWTRDELISGETKYELPDEYKPFLADGSEIVQLVQRSFNAARSGDILYVLKPYQIQTSTPATHGSPWKMDSHVPLLAIGCGITAGRFERPTSPAAIASTVARLLSIDPPSGNEEMPMREALGE